MKRKIRIERKEKDEEKKRRKKGGKKFTEYKGDNLVRTQNGGH